jgi:hypothetical protein
VSTYCFDCSVGSAFTNETQVSSPAPRTIRMRNSSPYLWYRCKWKSKPKPFRCVLCTAVRIFGTRVALCQPSLTVVMLQRRVRDVCRNLQETSEIARRWLLLCTSSSLSADGRPLRPSWRLSYSSFGHYVLAINCAPIIYDEFPQC